MVLKDLRVFLQRLSEEQIEESRRKSYGIAYTDTEDLEDKSGNGNDDHDHGNVLLPKKIGKRHHCPELECKFSSASRWNVLRHIRIHTGKKPYVFNHRFKCKLCVNVYSSSSSLRSHLTTHTGQKSLACHICWESFNWSYQLKIHEATVHFGQERQKDYKCSICECSYLNKSSLVSHMTQKHSANPKKFNCTFCSKSFLAAKYLMSHVMSHTGEKPFLCKFCPFKFSRSSNLNTHVKRMHNTHPDKRSHKCGICSKNFFYQYELDLHSKVHTGEKIHPCSECQMTFAYKSSLKSHMRTHTGEKPYTCTFCNKNFRHSGGLLYHTRTHTKETIKRYQCSECESKFITLQTLKRHMMIHTGEKPFTSG